MRSLRHNFLEVRKIHAVIPIARILPNPTAGRQRIRNPSVAVRPINQSVTLRLISRILKNILKHLLCLFHPRRITVFILFNDFFPYISIDIPELQKLRIPVCLIHIHEQSRCCWYISHSQSHFFQIVFCKRRKIVISHYIHQHSTLYGTFRFFNRQVFFIAS